MAVFRERCISHFHFEEMSNKMINKSFPDEFIDLLKQDGEQEKIKSMIVDQALHNFVDADGTRALHLAAEFNNVKIMYFLIKLGCNTEAEDSSGKTALMTALLCGNFWTGRVLFYERVLELTIPAEWKSERNAEAMHRAAADLTTRLRREKFSSERIGEFLARLECCLCAVMNLHDAAITKGFLRSEVRTHFYTFHQSILFERIVPALDSECVGAILHDGRWPKEWTSLVCSYVMDHMLNYQKTRAGRDFLRRLFSWQVFNEGNIECLEEALRLTTKKNIKIFLQYGFHLSVKEKFGRDIMFCLFGNYNSNIIRCMLKNRMIRLDGRDHENNTPLHCAAKHWHAKNIEFLLENGADPNASNDLHETPVTLNLTNYRQCSIEVKCLKSLLIAGADHRRICDEFNDRLFFGKVTDYSGEPHSNEFLASQLAIYEALGLTTDKSVSDMYNNERCLKLQKFYEQCREQLNLLKAKEVKMNFSMFSILVEKPMKIARHFNDQDLLAIGAFVKCTRKIVNAHYRETLKQHAKDIAKVNLCRSKAIEVICECIGIGDPTHLVVCKIVDYFSFSDLSKYSL